MKLSLALIENSKECMRIREYMNNIATDIIIKKNEIINDFIYKNIETNILNTMKLKIENELSYRKMKG